jgi:UDP-glucose 4-epimerase
LAGAPLQIHARRQAGDDGCERDYVYVGDIARANLLASQGTLPQLLNIGTGVATSTRSLALALAGALGRTPELRSGPPRAGDIQRSVLDPASCLAYLGELTSLNTGLKQTLAWFSEQASLEAQVH